MVTCLPSFELSFNDAPGGRGKLNPSFNDPPGGPGMADLSACVSSGKGPVSDFSFGSVTPSGWSRFSATITTGWCGAGGGAVRLPSQYQITGNMQTALTAMATNAKPATAMPSSA